MYLSDIENGKRPATTNLLPILIHEPQITKEEQTSFMDLVNVSKQNTLPLTNI